MARSTGLVRKLGLMAGAAKGFVDARVMLPPGGIELCKGHKHQCEVCLRVERDEDVRALGETTATVNEKKWPSAGRACLVAPNPFCREGHTSAGTAPTHARANLDAPV